ALILGSHWGIDEASCPDRPNPPAPVWHSGARWRFEAGLADDMIGYLIPAWRFTSEPRTFVSACVTDADDKDQRGHQHKLEHEGVGPTASNLLATHLAALLDQRPDPRGHVEVGRYLRLDGTASRRPAGAVGIELVGGRVIALPTIAGLGDRSVAVHARFMDYEGAPQSIPDAATRGMVTDDGARYYIDVY